MSTQSTQTSNSGVGLSGLLTVAFVVLKLTGHIDWSWWWVLAPLWISTALALLILAVAALVFWMAGR